jgi:hypothetical protein
MRAMAGFLSAGGHFESLELSQLTRFQSDLARNSALLTPRCNYRNSGRKTISYVSQRAARVCGDIFRHGEKDLEIASAFAAESVGSLPDVSWAGHLRYRIVERGRETIYVAGQRQDVVLIK